MYEIIFNFLSLDIEEYTKYRLKPKNKNLKCDFRIEKKEHQCFYVDVGCLFTNSYPCRHGHEGGGGGLLPTRGSWTKTINLLI